MTLDDSKRLWQERLERIRQESREATARDPHSACEAFGIEFACEECKEAHRQVRKEQQRNEEKWQRRIQRRRRRRETKEDAARLVELFRLHRRKLGRAIVDAAAEQIGSMVQALLQEGQP